MLSVERYDTKSPAVAAGGQNSLTSTLSAVCLACIAVTLFLAGCSEPSSRAAGADLLPESESTVSEPPTLSTSGQHRLEAFRQQVESSADATKFRGSANLSQAFDESTNRARVLVLLNTESAPPVAERFRSPQARASWQGQVSSLQSAVIGRVNASEMIVNARYMSVPAMACEVSAAGMSALLSDPNVAAVQADTLEQRHLAQGIPLMNVGSVRSSFDGSGMTIAVIDDGVDYTHPDLGGGGFPNSKVIGGIDTAGVGDADPFPGGGNSHGTSVSGIACGDVPGSITTDYIGGMAPGAKIAAVKVFADGAEFASSTDIVEGIDWCVTNQFLDPSNPILIINMSLGGGKFSSAAGADAADPVRLASVQAAVSAGITVIASSGNDGYCDSMGVPAALSPVISVGAVYDADIDATGWCLDPTTCYPGGQAGFCAGGELVVFENTAAGQVTAYSNTASFLDVFGASNDAYTPYTGTSYTSNFGGTSAASPYVAGAVALIQSAAMEQLGAFLSPAQVRDILINTGSPITDVKGGGLTPGITKPLVDVEAAYLSIATGNPLPEIEVSDSSLSFITPTATAVNTPITISNESTAGGLNLDFSIETSVEGEVVEPIGGLDALITASNVSLGNVYQATSDTTLLGIQSVLDFAASTTLTFAVYQMPGLAPGDVKTRIFSASGVFNGIGLAAYGSGPISVPLEAGNYYAIAVEWGAISIDHYLDLGPQPAVSFGSKVLAFLFNAPLPAAFTGDLGTTTYNMYQIITVGTPSWISVDIPMGSIAPESNQLITVTADATEFAPGTYEGLVTISSNDSDENPVNLHVGLLVGLQNQVYANFGFNGAEFGTMANPYNTLAESLEAVLPGGTVSILGGGASPETLDIAQDVNIEAVGGEATVGENGVAVLDLPPIALGLDATSATPEITEDTRVQALESTPSSRRLAPGRVKVMDADSTAVE